MVDSSAATQQVGECEKIYDVCAQGVEDLFIEVTSVNEEATAG